MVHCGNKGFDTTTACPTQFRPKALSFAHKMFRLPALRQRKSDQHRMCPQRTGGGGGDRSASFPTAAFFASNSEGGGGGGGLERPEQIAQRVGDPPDDSRWGGGYT